MKIAIIDDERPARSELRYLLSQVLPEAEIFEADGVKTADALMKEHIFQAIFFGYQSGRSERNRACVSDQGASEKSGDRVCDRLPGIRGQGI